MPESPKVKGLRESTGAACTAVIQEISEVIPQQMPDSQERRTADLERLRMIRLNYLSIGNNLSRPLEHLPISYRRYPFMPKNMQSEISGYINDIMCTIDSLIKCYRKMISELGPSESASDHGLIAGSLAKRLPKLERLKVTAGRFWLLYKELLKELGHIRE